MDRYGTLKRSLLGAWCPSLGRSGTVIPDLWRWNRNATFNGTWTAGAPTVTGGQQISVPGSLTVGGGDFTVAFWVWVTSYNGGFWALHDKGITNNRECSVFCDTSGNVSYAGFGGSVQSSSKTLGLTIGEWQHYSVTRFGSGITYYRNGVVKSTDNTGAATTTYPANNWSFGSNPTGGTTANCRYDDIRIFSRALSQYEISLLASARGVGLLPQRTRRVRRLGSQFWLKDAGTWKQGTPWIKVNGVWKQATANLNVSGTWK